jgi:hypothetical protein
MLLRDLLNSAGATRVAPQSTNPSLETKDINALLGNKPDNPLIIKKQALSGPGVSRNQAMHMPDDQYAIALGRERTRIDNEKTAYVAKQQAARKALADQLSKLEQDYADAQESASQAAILNKASSPQLPGGSGGLETAVRNAGVSGGAFRVEPHVAEAAAAKAADLAAQVKGINDQLHDFDTNYQADMDKYFSPMEQNFKDATAAAITLRDNTKKQSEFDAAYKTARAAYDNAVTQHDKDYAAFKMYQAKKGIYDQDSANRQADIDAGRYAVNPYQFMAQGAGINEIDELRKQVNAGNLRPNMRVPDAEVAPTEVKDPGEFKTAEPVHEHVEAPKFSTEVSGILGYKDPTPAPADAPVAKASTAPIDTSSVKSEYVSPADKNKKPEPEKDANGNPIAGAGTLQQTSTTANTSTQSTPQTQTAAQAATPAPALAPQPTGSTGGQTNATGQDKTAPVTPPPAEEKPAPFTPDEKTKEEQDSVF